MVHVIAGNFAITEKHIEHGLKHATFVHTHIGMETVLSFTVCQNYENSYNEIILTKYT